jgi:hypothetical protein
MPLSVKLTRRQLLRQSVSGLLAAGLWPGALAAAEDGHPADFHFLVINDTHFEDKESGPWLEKVVRQMKKHPERIDFCIHAGDLSHNGLQEQLAPVRDVFAELGVPTYYVMGNHDYKTDSNYRSFLHLFPTSFNYRFEHKGWQFIGLDTTQGTAATGSTIQRPTFRWLEETLPKLDRKRPTVLFTHFPLGAFVPGRPQNAAELLTRFKEINLKTVFNGHFHASTLRVFGSTTLTTNRCCAHRRTNHDSSKEKGYFLCRARDGKVERTFVEVKPGLT